MLRQDRNFNGEQDDGKEIYTNGGFVEVKGSPLSSEGEFISLKRK